MEIKILGTVSPYCKDDKNCPGYLVTDNDNKVLLDCGNGSTRNLNLPSDLNNLTIIISHLHKDHYGDLLSLGYASYVFRNLGYLTKRIKVYIPEPNYTRQTEHYTDNDGWGASRLINKPLSDYQFLQDFGDENFLEFITYKEQTKLDIGNLKIDFKKTPHPINTYSVRVKDADKIFVYSADTGYTNSPLKEFAKNADVFLCESTFKRGQLRREDNHLYAHEAATLAKQAQVTELVLTHFFPEIDREEYVEEAKTIFDNTTAATEGKVLKLGGIK